MSDPTSGVSGKGKRGGSQGGTRGRRSSIRSGELAGGVPAVQHGETEPGVRETGRASGGGVSAAPEVVRLADAVKSSRLAGLCALRDALAVEIEAGPQGEKAVSQTAALARQLREVLREVSELERLNPKKSVVNDLASRRKTRRSTAKGAAEAGGDRQ